MANAIAFGSLNLLDQTKHYVLLNQYQVEEGGRITLGLLIKGADPDEMQLNASNIQAELNEAERAFEELDEDSRITLDVRLNTTTDVSYFVRRGKLTPGRWIAPGKEQFWTLELMVDTENNWPVGEVAVDSRSVSGTLTNGAATFLVDNVGGNAPARVKFTLNDNSLDSRVIQRARLSVRHAPSAVVGDWDPVVDLTALTGATTVGAATISSSNASDQVICSGAHNFVTGDVVTISGHSGSTPDINGTHTITVVSSTTFTIPVDITVGGTGGTATPESVGNDYITRTLSSVSHVPLARGVMPSGFLNKGRFDLWARIYDSAIGMTTPTSFNGVPDEATVNSMVTSVTVPDSINLIQQVGEEYTAGTSMQISGSDGWATSTAGNLLLCVIVIRSSTSSMSTPLFFSPMPFNPIVADDGGGDTVALHVFYQTDASATSSVSATAPAAAAASNPATMHLFEIENVGIAAAIPVYHSNGDTTDTSVSELVMTSEADEAAFDGIGVLGMFATDNGSGTPPGLTFPWNGYEEWADGIVIDGLIAIFRTIASQGTLPPNPKASLASQTLRTSELMMQLRPTSTTTQTTTETYQEPTPGELDAGTYQVRIQAIDAVGNTSNASSTISDTLTNNRGAIDYTWSAPSATSISHYRLTILFGGTYYVLNTPDNTTSYSLTTLSGLSTTSGFPATSGSAPSLARVRAKIGTTGSGSESANLRTWRETPAISNGIWHLLYLGTFDLPPQGEMFDGTRPEWAIEIEARSAGGPSARISVDAIFLFSSTEYGCLLEYPTLDLAAQREYVYELLPSGRVAAWLENAGAESGQITAVGALKFYPGDNVVHISTDVDGGECEVFNTQFTVQFDVYEKHIYQVGA